MTTDATNKTLNSLAADLRSIAHMVNSLQTSDFETVDEIQAAIQSAKAELESLRLALAPEATDDLTLPEAA